MQRKIILIAANKLLIKEMILSVTRAQHKAGSSSKNGPIQRELAQIAHRKISGVFPESTQRSFMFSINNFYITAQHIHDRMGFHIGHLFLKLGSIPPVIMITKGYIFPLCQAGPLILGWGWATTLLGHHKILHLRVFLAHTPHNGWTFIGREIIYHVYLKIGKCLRQK